MENEYTSRELGLLANSVESRSEEDDDLETVDRCIQRMIAETQMEYEETILAWEAKVPAVARLLHQQHPEMDLRESLVEARQILDETIVRQHKILEGTVGALQGLLYYRREAVREHFHPDHGQENLSEDSRTDPKCPLGRHRSNRRG
jgi:hypothetical protein